jgi:hypothetical protein
LPFLLPAPSVRPDQGREKSRGADALLSAAY